MKQLFIVVSFFFVTSLLTANIRAPITLDDSFSGQSQPIKHTSNVLLVQEDMTIIFPLIDEAFDKKDWNMVTFHISYYLKNHSKAVMEVPAQFLAIDVSNPEIRLNGNRIRYEAINDKDAEKDFLKKINQQRAKDKTRDEVYLPHYGINEKTNCLSFVLKIKPGLNRVDISYQQMIYFKEYLHYEESKANMVRTFAMGFDYLFYPAFSWVRDPEFEISVDITVPGVEKTFDSNFPLTSSYDQKKKINNFQGSAKDFPTEIFTFIVQDKEILTKEIEIPKHQAPKNLNQKPK